ncbi:MAG: hypothetical protein REI96_19105 [Flavobacterium nitrogenifigens]|uniref:hypothetical protein n=1 Tax=Flavobacterium nitrogenifigens TaxID=1617283 RepID=UPI002809B1B9|nr:hypothetical protein [Flavobacterium nitrogenifigens]MDQ8014566.1 hypothetical protein [Flavobacterium nitrogenifigens]
MKSLENLSALELEAFLKFPVYISLLAANNSEGLDAAEKKTAIKFAHVKTFSCDPKLRDFYELADKNFEESITKLDNELPKGRKERELAIKEQLTNLELILQKMDKEYMAAMHRSMASFKNHVSKAHQNVLEYFVFPIPIKGLTD